MFEQDFSLPTPDGKTIYGRQTGNGTKMAIIDIHGLAGYMTAHHHSSLAHYFAKRDCSVFRFNLYGSQSDARKLADTTLKIHAQDMSTVIDYVKLMTPLRTVPIAVIGHSYGGSTILVGNPPVDKIILWDSSFDVSDFWRTLYEPVGYFDFSGYPIAIGQAMFQEGLAMDHAAATRLAQNIATPTLCLNASESMAEKEYQGLYEALACPKRHVVIDGADHCFTRVGNMDAALAAMDDFLQDPL